jgi:Zn-dependent peptidase ImmA (M78 family)
MSVNTHAPDSIEIRAEEVLRRFDAMTAPVNLEQLAAQLDVRVHYETLEDQAAGVLIVKGNQRHILVNKAHHPNRQRFTVAHELGHLVLHEVEGKDQLFFDQHIRVYQRVGEASADLYKTEGSTTTPEMEREANLFAAALLMPSALLKYAALEHDLWDEADVESLARTFAVSGQAMSIRLQQLKVVRPVLVQQDTAGDDNS